MFVREPVFASSILLNMAGVGVKARENSFQSSGKLKNYPKNDLWLLFKKMKRLSGDLSVMR